MGRVGGRTGHICLRVDILAQGQQCPVFLTERNGVADRPFFFRRTKKDWVSVDHPLVLRVFWAGMPLATR